MNVIFVRTFNALMALVLMGIICAAFYQQYFRHETPCPLCLLQRLGMIGAACGALMNLRFGIQMRHYALILLATFFGGITAGRQILLHICPGFPVFGIPVFGMGLYTWSFITFFCTAFATVVFLFFYSSEQSRQLKMNGFEKFAFGVVMLLTVANLIMVLFECGLGYCIDVPWPQP